MKKTKIICTLGPSTDKPGVLEALIDSGMDVARFNFSHGDHEEQKKRFLELKRARNKAKKPIAALLDTKGPEIRLKDFKEGKVVLEKGQTFSLTTREIEGDSTAVAITYTNLLHDVKPGDSILIDDGLIGLTVKEITDTDIVCTVENPGPVSNHKGVNVPNVSLTMPFISPKDHDDILFGIKMGYDFIAASFTRNANDILEIRKILEEEGCDTIRIIAKIENKEGVDNIDEILKVADGIMVARGDMGVEIPLEDLPVIQKRLIKKAMFSGKIVITATQMLDSMINNPRPTRAETTDVANAIYDGTSAIMLSGETAAGKYPVDAVRNMAEIAEYTESQIKYTKRFRTSDFETRSIQDAISHATCAMAVDVQAKCIVASTLSGTTARMVSRFRCPVDIIGMTTSEKVWRKLNLSWGVTPVLCEEFSSMEVMFYHAMKKAKEVLSLQTGDAVVLTGGLINGKVGNTNVIKVETVK